MNKNTTLFGGQNLTVQFEPLPDGYVPDGQMIKVRQIPVREYEAGLPLADDEPALVGFLCQIPSANSSLPASTAGRAWALTLAPESFEAVLALGREVNAKGFFSFCQRRMERAAKAQAEMIGLMATLPPETVRLAMEKGLAAQNQSRLPTLSPGFVSPPVR